MFELNNVTTGYGKFRVLKDISIKVNPGEIVCVVGANGAGKTTMMRAISGIIPIRQGTKTFLGKDLTRLSAAKLAKEHIVQVPEGRLIIKELSVEDNLRLGAYAHYFSLDKSELKQDMDRVFELFPILGKRFRQKAGTLSGGEQQMLSIGRGLMGRPKLLLLDEPSLGLAPLITSTIFKVIKDLNEGGLPILLVEQNVRAAMQISNRGYVLETGSVVMEGECSELLVNKNVIKAYLGA